MKNKLLLILGGLLILVIIVTSILFALYKGERKERKIADENLIAKSTEIQSYVTKHGDTVKVLQGLRLEIDDFKQIEKGLYSKIKSLEIKLKNATGIIQVVENIKYVNKDSIVYVSLNDSTRRFEVSEKWIKAKVDVTDFKYIKPGGFVIDSIPNTSTIVPSLKTKGWWIFKRKVGIECFIQNTNPYINVNSGTYIDLRKLK